MAIGIKLTASLEYFLSTRYPKEFTTISFGHVEDFTAEIKKDYLEWMQTDEGKSYLEGGENYHEPR